MEVIRNYVISNRVIEHKKELDRFILKEDR